MSDWLGTGVKRWTDAVLRPFEESRRFVRGLGLTSSSEWNTYAGSNLLPSDIPKYPSDIYHEQWISWPDWLGTERWTYQEARDYVRPLGITSSKLWDRNASAGQLPINIPRHPKEFYRKRGDWLGWDDFLGYDLQKGVQQKFKPFKESRIWARSIGLKSVSQWELFKKSAEFPSDIPKAPDQAYKEHGWNEWPDFLGYTAKQARHRRS